MNASIFLREHTHVQYQSSGITQWVNISNGGNGEYEEVTLFINSLDPIQKLLDVCTEILAANEMEVKESVS